MRVTQRDWSGLRQDGRALPRDVKIAIECMRANIGRPILIAELVVATAHSRTNLAKAFPELPWACPTWLLPPVAACRGEGCAACTVWRAASPRSRLGLASCISDVSRPTTGAASASCLRQPAAGGSPLDRIGDPPSPRAPYLSATMPTLVIAPFRTPGDRESNCLADALAELLAAELARGRVLAVRLATASASAMRRPEARYCLTGRVTYVAGRVRVIVRLIDVEEERHLWGDSFDGEAGDELSFQDVVV